jgi:hypothetical protein
VTFLLRTTGSIFWTSCHVKLCSFLFLFSHFISIDELTRLTRLLSLQPQSQRRATDISDLPQVPLSFSRSVVSHIANTLIQYALRTFEAEEHCICSADE